MRILSLMLVGMLFVAVWTNASPGEVMAGGPVIELDSPTYEFGEVKEGEVVTHDFKVFNRGNAPLEIKQVKPG